MYKRILIKISGEALSGNDNQVINHEALFSTINVVKEITNLGVQVALVVGAGNICRGALIEKNGIDRVVGDKMGMLGTEINALALMSALQQVGKKAVVLSAVPMETFVETHNPELAKKYLNEGYVVIFGGGIGKPFYSTDTCATQRAIEINADAILMAKNGVEGIYSDDPRLNKNAVLFDEIKSSTIVEKELKVMDLSAAKMLLDQDIDVKVFNMANPDNFIKAAKGEKVGTTIKRG